MFEGGSVAGEVVGTAGAVVGAELGAMLALEDGGATFGVGVAAVGHFGVAIPIKAVAEGGRRLAFRIAQVPKAGWETAVVQPSRRRGTP